MLRRRSSRIFVAVPCVLAAACVADPRFELAGRDPAARGESGAPTHVSGDAADDAMALIPTTTLSLPGAVTPAAPGSDGKGGDDGKGDDDGKGRPGGGGGGEGGEGGEGGGGTGAPESVPPVPAASTTTVPAFWLDVREVSAAAYDACVGSGSCTPRAAGPGCTVGAPDLASHPANCVTFEQAKAFCVARGKRLVRHEEWTAAAAGAVLRPFPWGVAPPAPDRLNACGPECSERGLHPMYDGADGWAATAPRGSFPAGQTPEGVHDLAGNVAEWVDLAGTTITRGGSFEDVDAAAVSSLAIRPVPGGAAIATVGFRCARDAIAPP